MARGSKQHGADILMSTPTPTPADSPHGGERELAACRKGKACEVALLLNSPFSHKPIDSVGPA
jgi:hypothetical protein